MFGARGVSSVTLGSLPPVLLALALGRRVSRKSACKDRSSLGSISRFVSARQLNLVYDRDSGSPIDITSGPTPKSPMSSSQGDMVPHMIIRSLRLQPGEFVVGETKRLLQHYLPRAAIRRALRFRHDKSVGLNLIVRPAQ